MTSTTAQGIRCGNRKVHGDDKVHHANVAEVRACFGTAPALEALTRPAAPSQAYDGRIENVNWAAPVAPRNADEARSEALNRLASQRSPFFQDRNMGREYPASDKQKNFVRDLAEEVLVGEARDAMMAKVDQLSGAEAKRLITDMLVMRGSQRKMEAADPKAVPARNGAALRNSLVAKVMGEREERNFAIIDEDGKARFYRISKRGKRSRRPGSWKIQERVTDMLLPRADAMLAKVCQDIIDQGGAEAAGQRFAELLHKCYECGASLTDTTGNPYYSIGLGPECGAK